MINNDKAKYFFSLIRNNLMTVERPLEEATSTNRNIIKASTRPIKRDKLKDTKDITDSLFKECQYTFKNKLGIVIHSRFGKVIKKNKGSEK